LKGVDRALNIDSPERKTKSIFLAHYSQILS
jgi:hypothetical protein